MFAREDFEKEKIFVKEDFKSFTLKWVYSEFEP